MSKILITGSTGFIGKSLLVKLKSSNHQILQLLHSSGDIADENTWRDKPKTDVVIHLAARTFVPDSWDDLPGFLNTNLQGTVCALNYCKEHKARLIFLSSYLYGQPKTLPIPESADLNAFNPYALSKKLAEEVCQFYADNFNIDITILRPFNVYGPGQHNDFLIPFIISQALAGDVIQVKDLEPKRDYVYIDDVIDFIFEAINLKSGFRIFNVGTGISHSVCEIIDIIQKLLSTSLPVRSTGERRSQEVMDTRADITKASSILGWSPKWSLNKGIEEILRDLKTGYLKEKE